MQQGSLLLLCSGALRWCCSVHAATFSVSRAWGRGVALSDEWLLLLVQAVLHGLALVLTGLGLAALEAFHDKGSEGRAAQAARGVLPLYLLAAAAGRSSAETAAAVSLLAAAVSPRSLACAALTAVLRAEFGCIFSHSALVPFSLLHVAALSCAFLWALGFEPTLTRCAPDLHSRDANANLFPALDDKDATASALFCCWGQLPDKSAEERQPDCTYTAMVDEPSARPSRQGTLRSFSRGASLAMQDGLLAAV